MKNKNLTIFLNFNIIIIDYNIKSNEIIKVKIVNNITLILANSRTFKKSYKIITNNIQII